MNQPNIDQNIVFSIQKNLEAGHLSLACDVLMNTQYKNDAIIFKSQLKRLERKIRRGVVTNEEAQVTENQITESILNLINGSDDHNILINTNFWFEKKSIILISGVLFIVFLSTNYFSNFFSGQNAKKIPTSHEVQAIKEFINITGKVLAAVNMAHIEKLPALQMEMEEAYHAKIELIKDQKLKGQIREFKDAIRYCSDDFMTPEFLMEKGKDLAKTLNSTLEKNE